MKTKVVFEKPNYGPCIQTDRHSSCWPLYLVKCTFYGVVCVYMLWSAREIAILKQYHAICQHGEAPRINPVVDIEGTSDHSSTDSIRSRRMTRAADQIIFRKAFKMSEKMSKRCKRSEGSKRPKGPKGTTGSSWGTRRPSRSTWSTWSARLNGTARPRGYARSKR